MQARRMLNASAAPLIVFNLKLFGLALEERFGVSGALLAEIGVADVGEAVVFERQDDHRPQQPDGGADEQGGEDGEDGLGHAVVGHDPEDLERADGGEQQDRGKVLHEGRGRGLGREQECEKVGIGVCVYANAERDLGEQAPVFA